MPTPITPDELRARLDAFVGTRRVPGAVAGIWTNGTLVVAGAGVCNVETGVEVDGGTLFQIGSITKLYIATVVMQLAADGSLELDQPVASFGDAFGFEHADTMTVRQLLNHTCGIEGDHFDDFGRGDDSVERLVRSLGDVPPLYAPGERYSYSNTAFSVLAHIIESLTGSSWADGMRERIFEPAGLTDSVTRADEAVLRRTAVGHVSDGDPNGGVRRARAWYFTRATSPAGAIAQPMAELLTFARVALGDRTLLDAASAEAMLAPSVSIPPHAAPGFIGVGAAWRTYDWHGERVVGHDGATIGQFAHLRVLPERGIAFAVLTNGPDGRAALEEIFAEPLERAYGVRMPHHPPAMDGPVEGRERFVGTYERLNVRVRIAPAGDGLAVSADLTGPLTGIGEPIVDVPLRWIDDATLLAAPPGVRPETLVFTDPDERGFGWMLNGGRSHRRSA